MEVNEELLQFARLIKGFKSCYMAGGIQSAAHPNSWRDLVSKFLEANGITIYNPVEDNKLIFNQSILGFKVDGTEIKFEEMQDVDELKEAILLRQTEINDKKYIKDSDLVIFYLDDRIGHGTMTEFDWCYYWRKPMIIIRTIPRRQLAHWTKWKRYFAMKVDRFAIEFKSINDMKKWFISCLNFKDIEVES